MTFTENLDHSPDAVTLETLPDGTAWLWLRKDVKEKQTENVSGDSDEKTVCTSYDCTTAMCKLDADRASETVASITASFTDWWEYAAAWNGDEQTPIVEERLAAVEDMLVALTEV